MAYFPSTVSLTLSPPISCLLSSDNTSSCTRCCLTMFCNLLKLSSIFISSTSRFCSSRSLMTLSNSQLFQRSIRVFVRWEPLSMSSGGPSTHRSSISLRATALSMACRDLFLTLLRAVWARLTSWNSSTFLSLIFFPLSICWMRSSTLSVNTLKATSLS